MVTELSYKTAICSEYERLLCNCVKALDSWRDRREEIADTGTTSRQTGDELVRLQADYAKAYSRLERHRDNCELCHFVSRMAGNNDASLSTAVIGRKHLA